MALVTIKTDDRDLNEQIAQGMSSGTMSAVVIAVVLVVSGLACVAYRMAVRKDDPEHRGLLWSTST